MTVYHSESDICAPNGFELGAVYRRSR